MNRLARVSGLAVAIALLAALAPRPAKAAPYDALTTGDAALYEAAFDAARAGDFKAVEDDLANVKDHSLVGHVALLKLLHPTAYRATYQDLADWLQTYGDLPGADRVYALAQKRRPADAPDLPIPAFASLAQAWGSPAAASAARPLSERGLAARQAYYSGDMAKALTLAPAAGQRWVAALAAYRLGRLPDARGWFEAVANDAAEDPWVRAGAAFWAARTAAQLGDAPGAQAMLRLSACWPTTFYGMIAERKLHLSATAQAADPGFTAAIWTTPAATLASADLAAVDPVAVTRLIRDNRRAHRAAALAQLGRPIEVALELRAGLAAAKSDADRKAWQSLSVALKAPTAATADPSLELMAIANRPAGFQAGRSLPAEDYPTPDLFPTGGFTLDRALVYAVVRQESRFNPFAVSSAGAMGLMQVRPDAAARAAGDDQLLLNPMPLFDGPTNLRIGQDHLTWLMDKLVGYDLLGAIAAYNGGPGPVMKVKKALGDDCDDLLLIESLPAPETREYVEHVTAAYWAYRRKFGSSTPTLDALASGSRLADVRLDR